MKITKEFLMSILFYDEETGIFTWKVARSHRVKVGSIAGSLAKDGGIDIRINPAPRVSILYRAHRLAWIYKTGVYPSGDIDHINGIRTDNRFCNLRDVSHCTNMQNMRDANIDNRSGLLGVTRHGNRFKARIMVNGKVTHIGVYDTAELAHRAYIDVKRAVHKGCTI